MTSRRKLWRLRDWPVRRKIVALLVAAAVLPLGAAAALQIRTARASLVDASEDLLAARADQLRHQLEVLQQGYELTVGKLAREAAALAYRSAPEPMRQLLAVDVTSDRHLLALAVVDPAGTVRIATEPRLVGTAQGGDYLRGALRGSPGSSELFVTGAALDHTPALAVAAPIQDDDGTIGAVVLWIRASALWELARSSDALAGPGSFAVVVDALGIRIAHSLDDALVFRPTAALAPEVAESLALAGRFGAQTRRWLADVRAFTGVHERAVAAYPDTAMFRAVSVEYGACFGVARRLSTSHWTVFYLLPERAIDSQIATMSLRQLLLVGAITIAVFTIGLALAWAILRPVAALAAATARISAGDLSARVPARAGSDELDRLAASFNAMAARIERDDGALRRSRDELERRVAERTTALVEASQTEARARAELEASTARLALLARTAHELAAASGEAGEVLELAARRIGESLGEVCAIRLISDDRAWLEPTRAVFHVDPALHDRFVAALGDARTPLADSLGGRIAATGQPLRIPVITPERAAELVALAPALRPVLERIGVHSLLAVPLRSRADTIGVVALLRIAPGHPYTVDDERFAQEIADRAGLAIDNAVLVATLERRVEARTAALEAANHELEAFSYSVSHDLRAPLRAIDGFSQMLLADHAAQLDDQGRAHLARVRGATRRMTALIDDLLDLARITRAHLRWSPVDLSVLAEQVVAELRRRDPARTTPVHVAPGLGHPGDAQLLAIVLENLLGNAWKFTAKHPAAEVWFEARDEDGRAVFRVRDTGAGFDMAHAEKLFVPFQRLHGASEYEGTGIGLATVQRIVQRHGGRIWAEAARDRGATFSFTLGKPG